MSLAEAADRRQAVKNAADPEQVETAARQVRDAAKLDDLALVEVMGTPAGRRIIWRQLTRAKVFETVFAGEATHTTAWHEGRRQAGLDLLADLDRLCPEQFDIMRREARRRGARTP